MQKLHIANFLTRDGIMIVNHKCGFYLDQRIENYQNKVGECTGVFWYHGGIKIKQCPGCRRKIIKAECMPRVKRVFGLPDVSLTKNNFNSLNIVRE